MEPGTEESARAVAEALGYSFRDRSLLAVALTHRSAAYELTAGRKHGAAVPDNERLEFLGDAVLALVVSELLFARMPAASEGALTRARAAVVNEASLAAVATRIGVGEALRLGRGEHRSGGRGKASLLANALEAVFAAVFLDGGIDAARGVIAALLGPAADASLAASHRDDKTTLQERMQAQHGVTPRYTVVDARGPHHDRTYDVEMNAGAILKTRGSGRSRKAAEHEAAREALRILDEAATEPPAGG